MNPLKKLALFGLGAFFSANIQAQTLHGSVKLQCDSLTPVEHANIRFWHLNEAQADTGTAVTDSLGNYVVAPFKIHNDPDTTITNTNEQPSQTTIEDVIITNNPGQGHRFIFESTSQPKGEGKIYNLRGQEVAQVLATKQNNTYSAVWNGETPFGLAKEEVYIFKQDFDNQKSIVKKFVQINNGRLALEAKRNTATRDDVREKTDFTNKSIQSLDQATYVFEITADSLSYPGFVDKTDTIVFAPIAGVYDFYANHFVEGVPNHRDIPVIIREPYDTLRLENVLVKLRDYTTGQVLDSSLTDSNGLALMHDIPLGTIFTLEYGNDTTINNRPDYFSRVGTIPDTVAGSNNTFADTIGHVRNRILPPKVGRLPSLTFGYNGSVSLTAEWVAEFVGNVDIEVAMNRGKKISMPNFSGPYAGINTRLIEADTLLNGADTNAVYVVGETNAIPITQSMIDNYDENSNYYPDSLGVRIEMGTSNLQMDSVTVSSGEIGIIGGTYITNTTLSSPLWEDIFGTYAGLPSTLPSGRASFVNSGVITNEDRALYKLRTLNEKARFFYHLDKENYSNVRENL